MNAHGWSRRRFSKEFKLDAIRQLEQGASIQELANTLSVHPQVLYRWKREGVDNHANWERMKVWKDQNRKYWSTHDAYIETKSKHCSKCGASKSSDSFAKLNTEKDGLQPYCKECHKRLHRNNPLVQMVGNAKLRAQQMGISFSITPHDLNLPEICPVLGIPLVVGTGQQQDGSPSLDRFDNTKGYTKENVVVISWRANQLKRDASVEELEKVLAYMKSRGV